MGRTARDAIQIPSTLTCCTSRNCSRDNSLIGPRILIPALLIKTSMRPNRCATVATNASTADGWVTSTCSPIASMSCSEAISFAADSASAKLRLTRATRAPADASPDAMALPRPLEPPVTMAVWSVMSNKRIPRVMASLSQRGESDPAGSGLGCPWAFRPGISRRATFTHGVTRPVLGVIVRVPSKGSEERQRYRQLTRTALISLPAGPRWGEDLDVWSGSVESPRAAVRFPVEPAPPVGGLARCWQVQIFRQQVVPRWSADVDDPMGVA